jgi:hypothetical protein
MFSLQQKINYTGNSSKNQAVGERRERKKE